MTISSDIQSVTIEPGNATRYDLDIIALGAYDLLVVLYHDRQRLAGVTMKFFASSMANLYRPHEVANKMGCDLAGAAVMLAYLRNEHGICVDLDTAFNQDTGVWTGATLH